MFCNCGLLGCAWDNRKCTPEVRSFFAFKKNVAAGSWATFKSGSGVGLTITGFITDLQKTGLQSGLKHGDTFQVHSMSASGITSLEGTFKFLRPEPTITIERV